MQTHGEMSGWLRGHRYKHRLHQYSKSLQKVCHICFSVSLNLLSLLNVHVGNIVSCCETTSVWPHIEFNTAYVTKKSVSAWKLTHHRRIIDSSKNNFSCYWPETIPRLFDRLSRKRIFFPRFTFIMMILFKCQLLIWHLKFFLIFFRFQTITVLYDESDKFSLIKFRYRASGQTDRYTQVD